MCSQLSKVRYQKKSNSQSQSGVVVAMVTKKPKRATAVVMHCGETSRDSLYNTMLNEVTV